MIKAIDVDTYSVDTAGLGGDEKVHFYMPPCRCGKIKNGVGINTGDGGWVIDIDDFLAIAKIIKDRVELEPRAEEETE